jgi:mannose-1-phosphate guanylyltransferase/mannose-1-phosphate guanylyltransferase/mannose-6-phosphate isomerase
MAQKTLKNLIHPVILCGGGGTRLWPRSRRSCPKPFLPLLGEQTLFQQTLARASDGAVFAAPIVVAGGDHVSLIEQQAEGLDAGHLIVEPSARNTAPAIALAAARLDPDAVMLVCPSDHFIADTRAFVEAAKAAAVLARADWLVSLAITPDRPEVGYGYIKRGEALESGYSVEQFVEKPVLERALEFLADGSYSWNGGIFAFRAGALLDELAKHRPQMTQLVKDAVAKGRVDGMAFRPDAAAFAAIDGESIDYAVMEHTSRAAMVPASMGWSDIGNWASLHDALARDAQGNHAPEGSELVDCTDTLVVSDGPRVSALGLEGVCIVVDGDEVLVASRDAAPHVGKLSGAKNQ